MTQIKMRKICVIRFLVLFFLGIFLSNCAPKSPLKTFPDFQRQKENIEKVHVLGDLVVLKDIKGKIDKLDIIANKELWDYFSEIFTTKLKKKGYVVEKITLTSSGLILDESREVKLVRTVEEKLLASNALTMGKAPFYIDESIEKNSELKENLISVYKFLDKYKKKKGEGNKIIQEATLLTQDVKNETLFVVMIACRTVPMGKQLVQGILTGLATLGTVAVWQTSGIFYSLYIIDGKTGELIWADKIFFEFSFEGGKIDKRWIKQIAKSLVIRLPPKSTMYKKR